MTGDLPLSPDDVSEIVAILDGSAYQSLDVKTSRFRVRIARDGEGWTQDWDFSEDETVEPVDIAPEPEQHADAVSAPLPGTFYRAPQPGAPPFVEVGDAVGPETVIGIIETMKLMNTVMAGADGSVAEILAENGAVVAKGAALIRLL